MTVAVEKEVVPTSLVVEGKLHNTPRSGYGKILPQGRGVVTAFALTK